MNTQQKIKTKTNHCFPSLKYILRKKLKKPNCYTKLALEPKLSAIKVLLLQSGSGTLSMNQMQTQLQLNSKSDGETTQRRLLSNILPQPVSASARSIPDE